MIYEQERQNIGAHLAKLEVSMDSAPFSNIHVLVVEDEFSLGRVYESQLQTLGYRVVLVNSATLAVAHLQRKRFNILFSDIRLVGKSGLELAAEVRQTDSCIGLLFVTGNPDAQSVREAQKIGAIQYITKPISIADLAEHMALASRWNIAQLISRSADRYIRTRPDRRRLVENALHRAKAELKNLVLTRRDAAQLIELAYARSPEKSELYNLLEARLGPYLG